MRVVHLTSVHSPTDVRVFQKQARSLAEKGHEVFLVATGDSPGETRSAKVTTLLLKKRRSRLARVLITAPAVTRRALGLNAEIYHFHDPELIPWCLMLKLSGHRVVMDVHEDYPAGVNEARWLPPPLRQPVRLLVRMMLWVAVRSFDGVVTADDRLRARYQSVKPTGLVIAVKNYPIISPELVRVEIARPRYEAGRVLFLGGISRGRVAGEFIAALELLSDVEYRAQVGGNYNDDELLARVRASRAWSRVDFLGRIPIERVNRVMLQASISVNLFADFPNHQELRSNRLFEALAAGLPVIVSDFPQWREFISKYRCGIAVNPHDPAQIAAALRTLLQSPERCMEMAHNGREAIQARFTWASQSSLADDLYQRIRAARTIT